MALVLRRALGQKLELSDPGDAALARRVRALAAWHRVTGFLEADPGARPFLHTPGAEPGAARMGALAAILDLGTLVRLLHDARIPVVPLKGPLLSARLFGDPTLRGCRDLDLLVPADRFDDALHVLGGRKMVLAGSDDPSGPLPEHHVAIRSPKGGHVVELHWQLPGRMLGGCASNEEIWSSVRPRAHAGLNYLSLDPAVEALFIASHAAGHVGYRIHWVTDVAALLLQLDDDTWVRALATARRWGLYRATVTAAVMAVGLLGVPSPSWLRPDYSSARTAARIVRRLQAGTASIPGSADLYWHSFVMGDDWRQRSRVAFRLLFVPGNLDREMTRLPRWADPIIGLLRPMLGLVRVLQRRIRKR